MSRTRFNRRSFLARFAAAAGTPALLGATHAGLLAAPEKPREITSRLGVGAIGLPRVAVPNELHGTRL